MPDAGETADRFEAYYQAALDKGADPLILLFVIVILVGLLILGLKFWLDYRTTVARIRPLLVFMFGVFTYVLNTLP